MLISVSNKTVKNITGYGIKTPELLTYSLPFSLIAQLVLGVFFTDILLYNTAFKSLFFITLAVGVMETTSPRLQIPRKRGTLMMYAYRNIKRNKHIKP
jgi:hypothetical protein